jgi:hypothetical protein
MAYRPHARYRCDRPHRLRQFHGLWADLIEPAVECVTSVLDKINNKRCREWRRRNRRQGVAERSQQLTARAMSRIYCR